MLAARASPHAFESAQSKVKEVAGLTAQAQSDLRSCHDAKLQLRFERTAERLEASRRELERGRQKAQLLRRALEAERAGIEHDRRGLSASAYAEQLETRYRRPLDETLAPLLFAYAVGIESWSQTLRDYAQMCAATHGEAEVSAFLNASAIRADDLAKQSSSLTQATPPEFAQRTKHVRAARGRR